MVRDIFEENGIRMAERNVKVEIEGGENLTEAEKKPPPVPRKLPPKA